MAGGSHPKDERLFAADQHPRLRAACGDLSWLLSRGYPGDSALALVGNRYNLVARQRQAVSRMACSDSALASRRAKFCPHIETANLAIDTFNVLLGVENILRGGVVLHARDGAFRDLASVHGSYRASSHTQRALTLITDALVNASNSGLKAVTWFIDAPVSNSGRLAGWIRERKPDAIDKWHVELVPDADPRVAAAPGVAASADRWVLDHSAAWVDLVAASAGPLANWRLQAEASNDVD